MQDPNTLDTSVAEQPTTDLLWSLIHWSEEVIGGKGSRLLSHKVHDWHTTTHRRQDGFDGFRMESYGSFSQFGGDNIKIWYDPVGEVGRTLVFGADYWPTNKEPTIEKLVDFNVWFPHIEAYVSDWVKKDERQKDKVARDARSMGKKRVKAVSFAASETTVSGISFVQDQSRWERDLEHGQEIRLLPPKEVWEGTVIEVQLVGSNGHNWVYVNKKHPDFENWRKLSLLGNPKFVVRDKPNQFILPAWARFLDLV